MLQLSADLPFMPRHEDFRANLGRQTTPDHHRHTESMRLHQRQQNDGRYPCRPAPRRAIPGEEQASLRDLPGSRKSVLQNSA